MLPRHPELEKYFGNSDYLDIKSIKTRTRLRPFIAGFLAYHPWWISMLYLVRELLVRILGLEKHHKPEDRLILSPQTIPFTPGGQALFFSVRSAREETYWVAQTPPDKHLTAFLGVVAEPMEAGWTRFHVLTAIHYQHWTGPVYFNLIRPFHHLVVWRMMKAGAACQV